MSSASWRSLARAVVLGAACVGLTSPARAQHVEIAGGAGWSTAPRQTTWSSRYEPPFPFVTHEGEATQDLIVAPDAAPVAWASLAWFPGPHVGIEARADYRRFEFVLGGHSVLFPGERRLSACVEPATTTGLVGGIEIALPLEGTRRPWQDGACSSRSGWMLRSASTASPSRTQGSPREGGSSVR